MTAHHVLEKETFYKHYKCFSVTFDQFNASFKNKSINLVKKKNVHTDYNRCIFKSPAKCF